jgi:hypothetical protein
MHAPVRPTEACAARAQPPLASRSLARWAWLACAALGLAVLLAPFLVVDTPAVLDYPNHLARFFILAHPADPVLSKIYAPHWALLPNVGMDLLGQALMRALPVHVAGRLLLAMSLMAPVAGAVLYARAAFGRWTWWSLGAAVVAYNGVFFLGFMNFLLGLGAALMGAAAWRVLRRRAGWTATALAGALIGICVYFCHLLGFAFFALLISAQEAEEALTQRGEPRRLIRNAAWAAARLALAMGPTLALYLITHHRTQQGDVLVWRWRQKLLEWATPFLTYDWPLTLATAVIVLAVALAVRRRAERASGLALGLSALAGLFVLAPFAAAGGTFLEARFPIMAVFWLFAGLAPRVSRAEGVVIASLLAALALGRSADVAWNWHGRAGDLAELRSELAAVPPGGKILLAETEFHDPLGEGRGRVLQGFARVDDHLPALAVIERRAFWPLLFADPGQQTVVVRRPYDRMAQALGTPPGWRDLTADPAAADLDYPYLAAWRTRFDYVLVLGPPPSTAAPQGLALLRAGDESSLYRVIR